MSLIKFIKSKLFRLVPTFVNGNSDERVCHHTRRRAGTGRWVLPLMSSRPESRATTSSPPNAANATTPFAPGQTNAWTEILALNKAEAKSLGDVGRPDSVLFVLGASGSGKTTLIRRLLYGGGGGDGGANTRGNETRNSSPKPGEGLEYHYARKSRATDSSRKDVAHVFEVSGSKEFADLLCGKDTVFFGARQVTTATALVTIDLSKPAEAVASLQYFLGKIKQAVTKTFTKLRTRGSRLPEQLKQRHRKQFNKFGKSEHPDFLGGQLTGDSLCGVQIVIACTKHDLHVNYDPEQRKVLSRALRNLAHRNGASLFYVQSSKSLQINSRDGGLNGRDNGSNDDRNNRLNDPTPNDPQNLQFTKLRAFVNHLVFVGADKAFPKTLDTEVRVFPNSKYM